MRQRAVSDIYLNIGHALDHLFMLIYPTALLSMGTDLVGGYGQAITLSVGGFIAFGVCSLPAGWLGDRWSRHGMMIVFFIGIGIASALTGLARDAFEIAAGLTLIGVFAAIYHPVGIAMLVSGRDNVGRVLGINGVAGNLGVAVAALAAAGLASMAGWRAAFILPGLLSVAVGVSFVLFAPRLDVARPKRGAAARRGIASVVTDPALFRRLFVVLVAATVFGGLVFNATTISMPKLFDERLLALTRTTLGVGMMVSLVYVLAAVAQLIVGYLIDRHPLHRVFVCVALGQAPLLLLAGWMDGALMLVVAVAMMFFVFGQIPINDAMVARHTDDRWRSRVYALRYVVSFGASAAAVPLVALMHGAASGFRGMYVLLAIFALGTLAAALLFARPTGATLTADG